MSIHIAQHVPHPDLRHAAFSPHHRTHEGATERIADVFTGAKTLSQTGHLPDSPHWRMLVHRHDVHPHRFDHYHPNLGRLIEAKLPCVGELPSGGIFDNLRERYQIDPSRFLFNHPSWGPLIRRNHDVRLECKEIEGAGGHKDTPGVTVPTTPPVHVGSIPEPNTGLLFSLGLIAVSALTAVRNRLRQA